MPAAGFVFLVSLKNIFMELYYSFSALIVLSAIFSYLNSRFLKLPPSIGVMVIALMVSLGLIATDSIFPRTFIRISTLIASVDLTEILMGAMLNFLLFAGAIHLHLEDLREQRLPVIIFSTVSVVISTFVIGFLMYYIMPLLGITIPAHPVPCIRSIDFAHRPYCRARYSQTGRSPQIPRNQDRRGIAFQRRYGGSGVHPHARAGTGRGSEYFVWTGIAGLFVKEAIRWDLSWAWYSVFSAPK
jgi:CPA1 family monovalent cation:H+ antiporter